MSTNGNILIGQGYGIQGDGYPNNVIDDLLNPIIDKAKAADDVLKAGRKKLKVKDKIFSFDEILELLLTKEITPMNSWVVPGFIDYYDYEYTVMKGVAYWRHNTKDKWKIRAAYR
jgi:hypothetical protein